MCEQLACLPFWVMRVRPCFLVAFLVGVNDRSIRLCFQVQTVEMMRRIFALRFTQWRKRCLFFYPSQSSHLAAACSLLADYRVDEYKQCVSMAQFTKCSTLARSKASPQHHSSGIIQGATRSTNWRWCEAGTSRQFFMLVSLPLIFLFFAFCCLPSIRNTSSRSVNTLRFDIHLRSAQSGAVACDER